MPAITGELVLRLDRQEAVVERAAARRERQ